jgi:hypothetical protein
VVDSLDLVFGLEPRGLFADRFLYDFFVLTLDIPLSFTPSMNSARPVKVPHSMPT